MYRIRKFHLADESMCLQNLFRFYRDPLELIRALQISVYIQKIKWFSVSFKKQPTSNMLNIHHLASSIDICSCFHLSCLSCNLIFHGNSYRMQHTKNVISQNQLAIHTESHFPHSSKETMRIIKHKTFKRSLTKWFNFMCCNLFQRIVRFELLARRNALNSIQRIHRLFF